jgi:hypothetical protein
LTITASDGYYFDGKKADTLVRDTKYVKIQVRARGARGRGSSHTATTTGTRVEIVDHYSVVREPGGDYDTHLTPTTGKGKDIGSEVASRIREKERRCRVLGCDGTPVNTGIHTGALREIQLDLKYECHQFVCLLHLNELFLRHRQEELDGKTTGPDAWSGPIGREIIGDVWLKPVVAFKPIQGNIKEIPEEVENELSRDASLLYKLGISVQTGDIPPGVASATIGPPLHARWLTTAARDLRTNLSGSGPEPSYNKEFPIY